MTHSDVTTQNDLPRRVILLRHGQTSWNAERRWQGRAETSLDATGLRQSERAAEMLVRDTAVNRLVSSTARRARQTATTIKGAFDLAGRPLALELDERLVEIDVGSWSGLTHDEVNEQYPNVVAAVERGDDPARGGDGERLSEAVERVARAFGEITRAQTPGDSAVVVSHGAVIRGLVSRLIAGEALRSFASIDNCRWVELSSMDGSSWRVDRWNAGA